MKKLLMGVGIGAAMIAAAWAHGPRGGGHESKDPQLQQAKQALMAEFKGWEQRKQALMQEFQQAKASGGDTSALEQRKQAMMQERQGLEQRKQALMQKFQTGGGGGGQGQGEQGGQKPECKRPDGGQKPGGWQKPAGGWQKPAGK